MRKVFDAALEFKDVQRQLAGNMASLNTLMVKIYDDLLADKSEMQHIDNEMQILDRKLVSMLSLLGTDLNALEIDKKKIKDMKAIHDQLKKIQDYRSKRARDIDRRTRVIADLQKVVVSSSKEIRNIEKDKHLSVHASIFMRFLLSISAIMQRHVVDAGTLKTLTKEVRSISEDFGSENFSQQGMQALMKIPKE